MTIIEPKRFCEHCGRQLFCELVGAETKKEYYPDGQEIPFASRYYSKTGERQMLWHFWCINKKTPKWFQIFFRDLHDDFIDEQIVFVKR